MAVDTIITRFVQEGESGLRSTLQAVGSDVDTLEGKLNRLEIASGALLGTGGGIVAGVGVIGGVSLRAASDVEMVERALTRSLGSAAAAQKKIAELRQFAADAPQFNCVDSARSFQMLQSMGMEADKILPLMRGVGNAVAAAGKGNEEFQRALVQLGQLVSKGKVQGEEILTLAENGIPAARILAKELGLTAEQVGEIGKQGITAEQAIAALTRGMDKEFGGAMEAGANTLQGQIAAFQDATEQLLAAAGKNLIPMATDGIKTATAFVEKLEAFISKNPDVVKYGLIGGTAAGGALVAGGGYLKLITILGNAKQAKDALTKSTKLDTTAEAAKSLVAGKEGAAIAKVGKAAKVTTAAKTALAAATAKESAAAAQAAAKVAKLDKARITASKELSRAMRVLDKAKPGSSAATEAASRVAKARAAREGILSASGGAKAALEAAMQAESKALAAAAVSGGGSVGKAAGTGGVLAGASRFAQNLPGIGAIGNIASRPLATGGASMLPGAANRYKFVETTRKADLFRKGQYLDTATGKFAKYDVAKAYNAQVAATQRATSGVRGLMQGVTVGGAALSAAGGVMTGIGAAGNLQAAGYKDGEAYMYGAATGIGAAGAAMFLPGGAVAVAIGEAAAFGINKLYNEPLEKAATQGSGLNAATMKNYGSMTAQQRSEAYFKQAEEKRLEARRLRENPNIFNRGRADELDLEAQQAMYAGNLERRNIKRDAARQERAATEEWVKKNNVARSKAWDWDEPQTTHQRNGETVIRIPNRPADNAQRRRRNQSMNPVPRYA